MEYRDGISSKKCFQDKNMFKISSGKDVIFVIQCLLHNVMNLLKSVLEIDAYQLKSAISTAIMTAKSLCKISIKMFMKMLQEYNEDRIQTLRCRYEKFKFLFRLRQ